MDEIYYYICIYLLYIYILMWQTNFYEPYTFITSEGQKPPNQRKQRSAGLAHTPDRRWKTSALARAPLRFSSSSCCAIAPLTKPCSCSSARCSFSAALSWNINLLCSSTHLPYSISNTTAADQYYINKLMYRIMDHL